VTFHSLRAAHASWLLAGDADTVVVQERLGHRQITTTQQYTTPSPTLANAPWQPSVAEP
jgi:integrase